MILLASTSSFFANTTTFLPCKGKKSFLAPNLSNSHTISSSKLCTFPSRGNISTNTQHGTTAKGIRRAYAHSIAGSDRIRNKQTTKSTNQKSNSNSNSNSNIKTNVKKVFWPSPVTSSMCMPTNKSISTPGSQSWPNLSFRWLSPSNERTLHRGSTRMTRSQAPIRSN